MANKKSIYLFSRILIVLFFSAITLSASSQPDRKVLSKLFLTHAINNEFSESYSLFSPSMRERLNIAQLRSIWNSVAEQYGELVYRKVTKEEEVDESHHLVLFSAFKRGSVDIHLFFNKKNQIENLFFAPARIPDEYVSPDYDFSDFYSARDVTVQTGDYTLPGTFYYPSSGKNIPVVVLIHGAGFHDRHSTFGPNKPFRDLAVGMASFGVGVLCFDKRTYVYPDLLSAEKDSFTVKEEIIYDAISAVELAMSLPESDPENIFILGHGFGGMIASRIAAEKSGIAGIIKMAANARPFEDVILEQVKHQALYSEDNDHTEDMLRIYEFQVMRVKKGDFTNVSASELPMNYPPSFWIDLDNYDHIEYSKNIPNPMLILQGERDYQVTIEDFEIWKRELDGKDNISFVSFPGLNHLMVPGIGRSTPAEYEFPGNVAIDVILDIVEWIMDHRRP